MSYLDDVEGGDDVSIDVAVAVGTRAAAELKIVVMLVITAEAQKVVRERQTGRAARQERASEVSAMVATWCMSSTWKARHAGSEDQASS